MKRADYELGLAHSFSMGHVPGCPFSHLQLSRKLDPLPNPIPSRASPSLSESRGISTVSSVSRSHRRHHKGSRKMKPGHRVRKGAGNLRVYKFGTYPSASLHPVDPASPSSPGTEQGSVYSDGSSESIEQVKATIRTIKPMESDGSKSSVHDFSFWTIADGWDKRPRPLTTASYRSLGCRTASSGRRIDEMTRPISIFCSRTRKYNSLMYDNSFVGLVPKEDQAARYSPGPIYNTGAFPTPTWPHRYRNENRLAGGANRFIDGQSIFPKSQGDAALFLPSESQVREEGHVLACRTPFAHQARSATFYSGIQPASLIVENEVVLKPFLRTRSALTLRLPLTRQTRKSPKGATTLSCRRHVLGSIYEECLYSVSPGPMHDVSKACRKVSTSRFEPHNVIFGAPMYGEAIKREMLERGQTFIQRLRKKHLAPPEPEEDDSSCKSSGSRSIYHARMASEKKLHHSWRTIYKDCLTVSAYAAKIAAQQQNCLW